MFIGAHPDDETIGCGGTILKEKSRGSKIAWLNATEIFEKDGYQKARVESRADEIKRVTEMYDFDEVFSLGLPTTSLNGAHLPMMVSRIAAIFDAFTPSTVYVTNRSDAHSDHRYLFDAVMACTKSFRYPYIKRLLMYECISETEFAPALSERAFIPNYFVDISQFMDQKLRILKVYGSELGSHPFPRSEENVRALATFRGATAGVKYAEAFQLLKFID